MNPKDMTDAQLNEAVAVEVMGLIRVGEMNHGERVGVPLFARDEMDAVSDECPDCVDDPHLSLYLLEMMVDEGINLPNSICRAICEAALVGVRAKAGASMEGGNK